MPFKETPAYNPRRRKSILSMRHSVSSNRLESSPSLHCLSVSLGSQDLGHLLNKQVGRLFVRSFVLSSEFFVPMKRSVRIAVLDGMDGRTIFARTPFISTFYELFEKFFYFSSFHLKAWDAIISIKMNGSYRTELSSFSWDGCQIFYWLISKNHCVII